MNCAKRQPEPVVIETDFVAPGDNHRNRYFTRGGRVMCAPTPEYAEFISLMGWAWKQQHREPLTGYWRLHLEITWQDRRRRDANNLLKTICDALERAGAVEDDKRIMGCIDATHYPGEGGRSTGMIIKLVAAAPGTYPIEKGEK